MAHRHRARPDETFPAVLEQQSFDRPADGIRAVEDPHRLAGARGGLECVTQRRDEGIHAAAEILEIDQQHVEGLEHRRRRATHRAVQAEYRDSVVPVRVVRGLDHVVLLVAAQSVLWPEGSSELEILVCGERVD